MENPHKYTVENKNTSEGTAEGQARPSVELKPEFCDLMRRQLGDEAEPLLGALSASAPATGVRLNPRKVAECERLSSDTVSERLFPGAERIDRCEEGLLLPERPAFTFMPELHAGVFYVQDPASMILTETARFASRELSGEGESGEALLWLDACAAPGGKTTAILAGLSEDSFVVANEFVAQRANILLENVEKWGYGNAAVTCGDTAAFRKLRGVFDVVSVDAPCSGEGMMRKDEEARRQWSEQLVRDCAALQREILDNVWTALRPGGLLVYSTCTFNLAEDEDRIRYLIDTYGAEPVDTLFNERFGIPGALKEGEAEDIPALRFMPHITVGEGLFLAVVRKPTDPGAAAERIDHKDRAGRKERPAKNNAKNKGKGRGQSFPEDLSRIAAVLPEGYTLAAYGDRFRFLPAGREQLVATLASATRLLGAGIEAGQVKGRDFIPDQALALGAGLPRLSEIYPEVELTRDEALSYLRREAELLPEACRRAGLDRKGYFMVTYRGLRLGFAKFLGNRANNLYPAQWRIRTPGS